MTYLSYKLSYQIDTSSKMTYSLVCWLESKLLCLDLRVDPDREKPQLRLRVKHSVKLTRPTSIGCILLGPTYI